MAIIESGNRKLYIKVYEGYGIIGKNTYTLGEGCNGEGFNFKSHSRIF